MNGARTTRAGLTRARLGDIACWLELLVAIAVLWFLWPAWLGGSTSIVVVSGTSMEPTYDDGDVLLVREGRAAVGDVIAFHVPGREGQIVHRVIERRADGTLLVQGDNRNTPDLPVLTGGTWSGSRWCTYPTVSHCCASPPHHSCWAWEPGVG